jgi:3-oxoacyl-[acyl-carrier protein] reductase
MGILKGKRALITGGGQGLGAAIARELSSHGCNIAVHYFSSITGAEEICVDARRNAVNAFAFQADLTDEAQALKLVNDAAAALGGIDILINNTGDLVKRVYLENIDDEFWNQVMDVNMRSMMYVTKYAVKYLAEAGQASIVNLASLAGRKGGHSGSLVYSTSKGAVITWTRALSGELAGRGIRVNCVAPGLMLGTRFHNTHTTEESARKTVEGIPLGRAGTAEDVARPVVFLASEYDGFITGATLDINGGVYCA